MVMLVLLLAWLLLNHIRKQYTESFVYVPKTSRNILSPTTNIYGSNRSTEIENYMLNTMTSRYDKAMNPSNGIVVPNVRDFHVINPIGVMPSNIDFDIDTPYSTFNITDKSLAVKPQPNTNTDTTTLPMFNNTTLPKLKVENSNENVSLLTGLPIEMGHQNMTPFFGKSPKTLDTEHFTNDKILHDFIGKPSDGVNIRQETPALFDPVELTYGSDLLTDKINKERFACSRFRQNETPFDAERVSYNIAGTYENKIRPEYKNVDELRVLTNPKITYEGRVLPPQVSSERGIHGEVNKNLPDMSYTQTLPMLTGYSHTAQKLTSDHDFSTNFQSTARESSWQDFYGSASKYVPMHESRDYTFRESFKTDKCSQHVESDRNLKTPPTVIDTFNVESFENRKTERETGSRLIGESDSNLGFSLGLSDTPRDTMRQAQNANQLLNAKGDFVKSSQDAFGNGVTTVHAKDTLKQVRSDAAPYYGQRIQNLNMGYTVNIPDISESPIKPLVEDYYGQRIQNLNMGYTVSVPDISESPMKPLVENHQPAHQKSIAATTTQQQLGTVRFRHVTTFDHNVRGAAQTMTHAQAIPQQNILGEVRIKNQDLQNRFFEPKMIFNQIDSNPYILKPFSAR